MFGLTDEQLLQNGIKIIDGIAGGGKSSMIDNFFRERNIPYTRLTSTNRLSRDASVRYNMEVKTIAAGLFTNQGVRFYIDEKEAPSQHIVIDEILQAHPKAIEWCINHADTNNIIITTDSKQLLSPENEARMVEAFTKLKMRDDVIYVNTTKTLRARDKKTLKLYNMFYSIADTFKVFKVEDLKKTFTNIITYDEMEYNINDAYITHDNATEDFLYKDKEFMSSSYLDLIPKGCIASKPPKDLTKYPLLSQIEAQKTHAKSYTQVMNVGTPVRFQGSEVTTDQKLYFLVQENSVVSARELYTVITRMWSIDSFVIVLTDTPKNYEIETFYDLPVKTHKWLTLDDNIEYQALSNSDMNKIVSKYDTDKIYYDRSEVRDSRGHTKYMNISSHKEYFKPGTSTAGSIARRDSKLNYTYMDMVYSILEKHGLKYIRGIHKLGKKNKDNYELDLFSAYPTIMKYEKLPVDGYLTTDEPSDDKINFYAYKGTNREFTNASIVTDDMKEYMESKGFGPFEYLFSTPYSIGCYPGDLLHAKAHDTIESKNEIKDIHYGYYQKHYLELAPDKSCYVRYDDHKYELFICQIISQLTYYMCKLSDEINGTSIIIDAVNFPCYNEEVKEKIAKILPDYFDYRIRLNDEDRTVVYQTYEKLLTRKEKRNARERERRKKINEELKAIRAERSKKHE